MDLNLEFKGTFNGLKTNFGLKNSFGIDVSAAGFIEVDSVDTLKDFAQTDYVCQGGDYMVVSGANNILFCDNYKGVVLHPTMKNIDIISNNGSKTQVRVGAGLEWDELVEWSVNNNLWGLENLSLIPGFVGAAPIQNIGAYGVEAKDCIVQVEAFDMHDKTMNVYANEDCKFAYRESIFKRQLKGRVVVLSVVFELSTTPNPKLGYGDIAREVESRGGETLANIRNSVIAIRQSKLPDTAELGNAGSFFKNPVVEKCVVESLLESYPDMPHYNTDKESYIKLAAGWLIEKSGLKGVRQGSVGVHARQALVLVNYGGATGKEIIKFAEHIRATVHEKFGVNLEFEVNIIG